MTLERGWGSQEQVGGGVAGVALFFKHLYKKLYFLSRARGFIENDATPATPPPQSLERTVISIDGLLFSNSLNIIVLQLDHPVFSVSFNINFFKPQLLHHAPNNGC